MFEPNDRILIEMSCDDLEYPIYFEDRRIGKSKMTVPVKFEAAWRVWQVVNRHRGLAPADRRPA